MSDGGGESGKESDLKARKYAAGSDEFVRAIARIAVAQVCENEGFQSFQQSALEALADVAVRYVREIGKVAHFYANLAGRTESNAFDVIQGLEDLGLPQGFLGSSDVHRCLAASNTVREISRFISINEDIPFAYSLPRFPVIREPKLARSFLEIGEDPPGEHIPAWLPAFPNSGPSMHPLPGAEKENEDVSEGFRQPQEHRNGQQSVELFRQQPVSNNGPATVLANDHGHDFEDKGAAESNPFLAPPLKFGEKDISAVVIPAKLSEEAALMNQTSATEKLNPDGETGKSSLFENEGRKNVVLDERPRVRLKLNGRRKFLAASINMLLRENESERTDSGRGSDDEKEKEKRSAKHIAREATEISQGIAQL